MDRHRRLLVTLAVTALAASLVAAGPPDEHPGGGGGPGTWPPGPPADEEPDQPDEPTGPFDYAAQADQLSQPDFPETVREALTVEAHDGEQVYVEVVRPDPAVHGDGPWPVVMEASPYHGTLHARDGTRVFPDPEDADGNKIGLTGYFAPRGYAVVMMDLRGTGRSTGCLDHLGADDAKDLESVIEWAADAPWSNGRVGLTGHSYVGSTPSIAAGQAPDGLVTIAPSAGLASMYDHQYQHGVPWNLQWVGPMVAYEQLALERDLPGGDNSDNAPNEQTGCGLQNSSLTAGHGQVTGEYQAWHAERDWRREAARADLPIFMIHGVNDNAARIPAAEWFFGDRVPRPDDKVWIGQWDHGSSGNTTCTEGHVNCRFEQWQYALHAWFDFHLKQMDVETGPTVESFLNGQQVYVADQWDADPGAVTFYPDATDGSLSTTPPTGSGSVSFSSLAGSGGVEFVSEPLEEDLVLTGMPQLTFDASVTGQVVHLVTGLWVEDGNGDRREANYCAINPHLRHDVATPSPVVPGMPMELTPQCFAMAHHVEAGERLVLTVGTTSRHHVPTFAHDAQVAVHTGPGDAGYRLPLVADAELHDDPLHAGDEPVEAGPAQGPISGSVTLLAPAAGAVEVEGVTDAFVDFTVGSEWDNAELQVRADVTVEPADIDLYLYQLDEDGNVTGDAVASGTSFDLTGESLSYLDPPPGDYRLQIQNWAGSPNVVDYLIRFINSAGEVGTGDT